MRVLIILIVLRMSVKMSMSRNSLSIRMSGNKKRSFWRAMRRSTNVKYE